MKTNFEPRVRFNWGYHDGANNHNMRAGSLRRSEGWAREHFDRAYGSGFVAGMQDQSAGRYTGNSDLAFQERRMS